MVSRWMAVLSLVAGLGFSSLCHADATPRGIRVAAVSAPAYIKAETRRDFAIAVRRQLTTQGLERRLRGYTVAPALVEFRRSVDRDSQRAKLSCVVNLALVDKDGALFGTVQGRANASEKSTNREVVDFATQSAVRALVKALG